MYYLKNTLFLDLSKNQKASLFSFIKAFTKKHQDKSTDDILQLFVEDEQYYFEQKNPHFEWIVEKFESEVFTNELKIIIKENLKQLEIKEAQKPYLEKQKAYAKQQRHKAQEYKLSKEPPSKKQLYYYDKLCKKYNIKKINVDCLSKLDLKNMIGKIINDQEQRQHYNTQEN